MQSTTTYPEPDRSKYLESAVASCGKGHPHEVVMLARTEENARRLCEVSKKDWNEQFRLYLPSSATEKGEVGKKACALEKILKAENAAKRALAVQTKAEKEALHGQTANRRQR